MEKRVLSILFSKEWQERNDAYLKKVEEYKAKYNKKDKEVKKDEDDFNPEEKNEQYAIEFLHKSLMEYMVASYIYDYLDENFLETKRMASATRFRAEL